MGDKKNFRSNYYEKVGFKSVDVKKSLESILNEVVIDRAKLAQFVIKYEIPVQYRTVVWKYLLNICSCNKQASPFVWRQRREQYEILLKSLITMRRLPALDDYDDEVDRCRMMSSMLALEENRLQWSESRDSAAFGSTTRHHGQSLTDRLDDFDVIFDVVEETLTMEDDVEMYWICRNLHTMIVERKKLVQAQMKELEAYIRRKDAALAGYLEKCSYWRWPATSTITSEALRLAFAGIFRPEAVLSLWDKIVSGSAMAEVFVLAEILLSQASSIQKTPSSLVLEKLERILRDIPIMNQHTIIDRALEIWQTEFGGVLHPNLNAPVAGNVVNSSSTSATMAPASLPTSSTSNEVKHKMSMDVTSSGVTRMSKQRKFSHFMKL